MDPLRQLLNQAFEADGAGRPDDAESFALQAVTLNPHSAPAWHLRANVALRRGDIPAALEYAGRAAECAPGDPEPHGLLAQLHLSAGRPDDALAHIRRAVDLTPTQPHWRWEHAGILLKTGAADAAIALARRLATAAPRDLATQLRFGNLLLQAQRPDEAAQVFRAAGRLEPKSYDARLHAGLAYAQLRRTEDAINAFRAAIRVNPERSEAHFNLGLLLLAADQYDDALNEVETAVSLLPGDASARNDLASILRDLGRSADAEAEGLTAAGTDPKSPIVASNLLYTRLNLLAWDADRLAEAHRDWGRRFADSLHDPAHAFTNSRDPDRPLRIGYVSPNFRDHAVNFFVEPILRHHDRTRFEIHCYADVAKPDAVSARIRGLDLTWTDTTALPDDRLAQRIREDGIDILIDLSGHLHGNRLLTFARRAAPIQMTYIGYQTTTGIAQMDWRITDDWSDPPGETEALHTERLLRIPGCFFTYQPSDDAPPVTELPALRTGAVTFGSFNNLAKVDPPTLALWARILGTIPDSRLRILSPHSSRTRERIDAFFAQHGIAPDRWDLIDRCDRAGYLRLISTVDIALDPLPFLGHTTTCDLFWMGVPVISLIGRGYHRRFGAAVARILGLDQCIATTEDAYVQQAVSLATDLPALSQLRAALRPRMAESLLTDAATFTRQLEQAYRQAWTQFVNS